MSGSEGREIAEIRFAFGRNWTRFLNTLDEDRIAAAASSLVELFDICGLHCRIKKAFLSKRSRLED